jgi:hypothetical protein
VLWNGSATSAVDLNPAAYSASQALGVGGGQQVGWGIKGTQRALLWSGSPGSFVDINGPDFNFSEALDTNGTQQVGRGRGPNTSGGGYHAVVWSGTPESMFDLHSLLPAEFNDSIATSIDSAGNIYGRANDSADGNWHAIEWAVVPEPAGMGAVALLSIGICARGNRRHAHS